MVDEVFEDFKAADLQTIKSFKLSNDGAFTINGYIKWRRPNEKNTHSTNGASSMPINVDQSQWVDPEKLGVPSGAFIELCCRITFGDDRTFGKWFVYDPSSEYYYKCSISGTTWDSDTHNQGRKQF